MVGMNAWVRDVQEKYSEGKETRIVYTDGGKTHGGRGGNYCRMFAHKTSRTRMRSNTEVRVGPVHEKEGPGQRK